MSEKKIIVSIPLLIYDRISNKRRTKMTIKDFVTIALEEKLARVDIVETFEELIPRLISEGMAESDQSNMMREFMAEFQQVIAPVVSEARLRQIDVDLQQALSIERWKVWLLHRVAIGGDVPDDLALLRILQLVVEAGYLSVDNHGVIQLSPESPDQPPDSLI
ncbi:MAG: hypothetical protein IH840_00170 [Candidatus Heimdallarchaeota archaeon]|nr:hypothetical protein [Candidatus Heimdallarchaeota archaeon]